MNGTAAPDSRPAQRLHRVRIVLSRTSHPGNIGAAARAMKTMGLSSLYLVSPKIFPDAQAEAMAAGATDLLANARVCASLDEALSGTVFAVAMTARRRELASEPLWVRDAMAATAAQLAQDDNRDVAIVFGNETAGLSNEDLALCSRWAMIPCDPQWSSLNLAAAVQIACYELRLAKVGAGDTPKIADAGERATFDEIEGLIGHFESAAVGSGFLDPSEPKRLMHRLRRLFSRAGLEKVEVNILRGILGSLIERGKTRP